jgi:hypothetical protein
LDDHSFSPLGNLAVSQLDCQEEPSFIESEPGRVGSTFIAPSNSKRHGRLRADRPLGERFIWVTGVKRASYYLGESAPCRAHCAGEEKVLRNDVVFTVPLADRRRLGHCAARSGVVDKTRGYRKLATRRPRAAPQMDGLVAMSENWFYAVAGPGCLTTAPKLRQMRLSAILRHGQEVPFNRKRMQAERPSGGPSPNFGRGLLF